MKKTFVFIIAALLLVSGVLAVPKEEKINNGFNTECQNFYNDTKYYTIAKFEYGDNHKYKIEEQNSAYSYYDISVTGNLKNASWTSTPDIYSVLVKAGINRVEFDGGASGLVTSVKDISHLTFCGYKNDDDDGGCKDGNCNGVPEYSTLTIGFAVITVLFGLVFLRKR